ncbi:hypothetical protein ISU10_03385 [Nocardioides agariphilus]|uniref:Uncharacterized protein n=1 Tax=Nocardioides agariphilus TaxID=433664 RepID=A0A930VFZ6_9ACTN|nr:hypothetical protein [Nocardioides agariphilus]MBF4766809.1 hypothetical protein [Nocardioides agariphilus]
MSLSPRTRGPRIASLLGFLALLLTAVLGTASTASAHYTSEMSGTPGPYNVNNTFGSGPQVMIRAQLKIWRDANGTYAVPTYSTNGVTVARTTASKAPQTIRAAYVLQRYDWTTGWTAIANTVKTVDVAGYDPATPTAYPSYALQGHVFENPRFAGSQLRIVYMIRWEDKATHAILGQRTVVPTAENIFCSFPTGWSFYCAAESDKLTVWGW